MKRWKLRQDSGDPIEYVQKARDLYKSAGIDMKEKNIVFSDALNLDKAIKIKKACDEAGLPGKHLDVPVSTRLIPFQRALELELSSQTTLSRRMEADPVEH